MYLLLRHHQCWIFTVLFVAVSHVDRGQCQDGFLKTYFQNGKAGFVKTDEKTYHAEYEVDLNKVLQKAGRFFTRFTDTVVSAVTDPPNENEQQIQETSVGPEDDCDSEKNECSHKDQDEEHLSTTEGTTEPLVGENQTPTVENQPSATEKAIIDEKPISKAKFFQKKKKKKFQVQYISLLDNFKLLLNVPIKICKYKRIHCTREHTEEERAEQKAQHPSEDYCDLVT